MKFTNNDKKTIEVGDGDIGSGKSLFTCDFVVMEAERRGGPFPLTIATPTNGLSKQWQQNLEAKNFRSMVISQDEGFRSSTEKFAQMCDDGYQGALCVNNMVALESDKEKCGHRLLIIDEAKDPLSTFKIKFKSPDDVAKLRYREARVEGYYELVKSVITGEMVEDDRSSDESFFTKYGKTARELGQEIDNPHYSVIIDKNSLDEARDGTSFLDKKGNTKKWVELQFTSFMHASILDDQDKVIILSSQFYKTLMALMWKDQVNFVPHEWITSRLDNDYLKKKSSLVRLYHPPVANLSKSFFNSLGDGNRDVGNQAFNDQLSDCIARTIPGKKHIFCTNDPDKLERYEWKAECTTKLKDDPYKCSCKGCGTRVIVNPHGWNHLRHFNMAVFAAGINFDPVTERRLFAFYGITREQAKEALAHQMVLQFLGRTSLRDPNSTEEIFLIAPDAKTAAYIERILGCAASTALDMNFGEPAKKGRPKIVFRTDEEQRAYERERKAAQRAAKRAPLPELRA